MDVRLPITVFDALVRRAQGVFEFSRDPACLLRARLARLVRSLELGGLMFPAGTAVVELHLWNERIPPFPVGGPDVAWAARAGRRLKHSLGRLAAYVNETGLAGVPLVGGTTILADGRGSELLLRRLGFECRPHVPVHAAWIERRQERYARQLMAAFNPVSLQGRTSPLQRTDVWITMGSFIRRYGGQGPAAGKIPPQNDKRPSLRAT